MLLRSNYYAFETPCPDSKMAKMGLNGPKTNRVNVLRCLQGLSIETNNFAFEVKVILGLESTLRDDQGAKIGLNGPQDQQG